MGAPADIAILFHARDRRRDLSRYAITKAAGAWREAGLDVRLVFGPADFKPARLALLHIDLTVVPDAYLELAGRYPRTLNGSLQDIRKSTISRQLVRPGDGYDGPVIVKTDRNNGGYGERRLAGAGARLRETLALLRRGRRAEPLRGKRAYAVYDRVDDAPGWVHGHDQLVIERFLPERVGRHYLVHNAVVLGSAVRCTYTLSEDPVVCDATALETGTEDPHPIVGETCRRFGLDYGKLDYTLPQGSPVLLDVNKTVGSAVGPQSDALNRTSALWWEGIFDFIDFNLA